MSRLRPVRRLLGRLRIGLLRSLGTLSVLAGLVLLGKGALARLCTGDWLSWPELAATGLVSGLLVYKMAESLRLMLRGPQQGPLSGAGPREFLQLEAGAALCVATLFLLQALGGARSPLHPLVYALAAFLSIQHGTRNCVALLVLLLVGEGLLLQGDGLLRGEPLRLLVHGLFIALFATLHLLFFKSELWRQRKDYEHQIDAEIGRMREEAVDFRLLSAGGAGELRRSRAQEEVFLSQSAVVVIRQNMRSLLALLRRSLHLNTCVLLWPGRSGDVLRVKEVCTADGIEPDIEMEMAADAGAVGTIGKSRTALNLASPKPSHLPYYKLRGGALPGGLQVGGFLGVPMPLQFDRPGDRPGDRAGDRAASDSGPAAPCAVLCVDRPTPFSAEDEALVSSVAEQILRALQSERVFAAIERSRYEHERLYAASEKLNRALTPEQVHKTAFFAVAEICPFDFAAIVTYDRQVLRHTVVAVDGPDDVLRAALFELSFADNAGLCAMAVKNCHALPKDGVLRDQETPIFDDQVRLRGMESLLVLPLLSALGPVGTLVCASKHPRAFGKNQREMLGVIANQVAVSLENARMYQAMEAMATTDGLTGLTNRRAYQERFGEMLQRAERQGKSLTLLMTDIDHFKKVNDTYGHPVGDVVLRRVAQVVESCVRKIDMAARYGGEEFAVVLEATDRAGGRQLAERVRQEVQRLWFHSDKGPFQCTLSLGMATFPLDGRDVKTLSAHADQALYHAKHNGRNQAVAYDDMREQHRAAG